VDREHGSGVDHDIAGVGDDELEAIHTASAGPPFFSPARLACEPWHGQLNHWLLTQLGTRNQMRHFW
jgi:hypothetical protein